MSNFLFSKNALWSLALLSLLLLSAQGGCRKKNGADEASTATKPRSVEFLQKKLADNTPKNVERLAAKAKIALNDGGNSISVTANLIWVKDSVLWLNVKKFGFEAARALIRPDSIFVLNRLEKTLSVYSWDWLRREYQLPGDFSMLEPLVLGAAWFDPAARLSADIHEGLYRLTGLSPRTTSDYRIADGSFRLQQMTFSQQNAQKSVSFGFDKYEKLPALGLFPYLRSVEAFSPDSGASHIEIELSDVEINVPKSWRFEIPAHYKRVD